MKTRPPCLEWREKLALRHEDLTLADQQALDAHVATCKTCAAALADYHFFEARLDALSPPAIKPLPRLSPHFFEQTESSGTKHAEKGDARTAARVHQAPRRKERTFIGRFLSVAAITCLLLASVLLFRMVYQARLAAHPGGNTLLNLNQHTEAVAGVTWSPGGKYIATASWDHTVKVWNAQTGELLCTYYGHSDEVYALAWSPHGGLIASGGGDDTVQVWDALNCTRDTAYALHTEASAVASIAWSPDGTEIASGGWDFTAQVWNVSTGKILRTLSATDVVSSIAWASNGNIAVGSWDGYVNVWSATGNLLDTYHSTDEEAVNAVAWSPQQPYLLAIGDQNGTVEVWNTSSETLLSTYTGYIHAIFAVAWSPNGTDLALGGDGGTVQIWNPRAQKILMTYTGQTNTISSLAWSPGGQEIVSGSFDFTAQVWKVVG